MSQTLEQVGSAREPQEFRDFDYKPISPLAPVSAAIGVFSALGLIWDFANVFGVVGVAVGLYCLRQIRRSGGTVGGKLLGRFGVVSSLLFCVAGTSYHLYSYVSEVPEGYRRVNFTLDISKYEPIVEDGQGKVAPEVAAFDDEKVFVKGYMLPIRQTVDLSSFVLVKDNQQCCFGGQPKLTDMIYVEMSDGKTVDYSNRLVSVAGLFHTRKPDAEFGEPTLYKLDCQHFSIAATSY